MLLLLTAATVDPCLAVPKPEAFIHSLNHQQYGVAEAKESRRVIEYEISLIMHHLPCILFDNFLQIVNGGFLSTRTDKIDLRILEWISSQPRRYCLALTVNSCRNHGIA